MKTENASIVLLMMLVTNFTIYLYVAYLQKKQQPGSLFVCVFNYLFNYEKEK